MVNEEDLLGAQQVLADRQGADRVLGDQAAGVADDVRLSRGEPQRREDVHARVHAGHDRDLLRPLGRQAAPGENLGGVGGVAGDKSLSDGHGSSIPPDGDAPAPPSCQMLVTSRRYPATFENWLSRLLSLVAGNLITMNLLERAAARREMSLAGLDAASQAELGQFFTPVAVARIMADLVRLPESGTFRVLDPGAGSGVLTAAVVDRLRRERPDLQVVLTAVEADRTLWPVLADTLADCEMEARVVTALVKGDFVDWALRTDERFDLVIQNPPYRKIRSGSALDRNLRTVGIGVPNIYAGFMALGTILLDADGQQVSITPRSWMNGTYFRQFRRTLLDSFGIDGIHTFQSRSEVFGDLGVLQETIIVSVTRGVQPPVVRLSSSVDHRDMPTVRDVPASQVVTDDFVFVPASREDAEAVEWMRCAHYSLTDLGLTVSTGRVVDFRLREHLRNSCGNDVVPMVYSANIVDNVVLHPRPSIKKPQWFHAEGPLRSKVLVPAGTYVLVKRFSAKEERRRIVAAVWSDDVRQPAFDNKLNYIHCSGRGVDRELALGLAVWLNSKQVDDFFRVFSGHTQVNAGDLRKMKFPSIERLLLLGRSELGPDDAVRQVMAAERMEAA